MVDEQKDDWAPLTPEQLAMRPGEIAEARPVRESSHPAGEHSGPGQPAAPPAEQPVDLAAEQMLRDLQERVARTPESDSLIASAQRRQQRVARQLAAARRVADQLESTCVVGELPKEPAPVLEITKQCDMDPRELEPWFRQLPEDEQERLRQSWLIARHKFDHAGRAWRRRMLRAAGYGTFCFVLTGLLMSFLFMDLTVLARCILVGPFAGAAAQLLGGERFTYGLLGAFGCVVAIGGGIMMPFAWYGLLFCMCMMAAFGMDGEMRRSAGCRDD